MDRNPGLSIGAVQEITPNLEVPGVLTGQHKANLDVHLNYIEGSSLNILWERLTEEFKSSFIESMKKLESCFKDMYSKNGFTDAQDGGYRPYRKMYSALPSWG